jgi:hypothetical protein
MRVDSSGRVGIGTTSPSHQLTVHNASTTGGTIEANRFSVRNNYGNVSGLGNGFVSPASNTLAFATNSTERMRIYSDGGISFKKYLEFRDGADTTYAGYLGSANHLISGGANTDFALRAEANLLFASGGNNERMRIDSSGNVIVGSSATPDSQSILTVNDQGTTAGFVSFENRENYGWGIGLKFRMPMVSNGSVVNSGRIYSGYEASGKSYMRFDTYDGAAGGEFERMRISSAGHATFSGSVISGSLAPGGGGGNYLSVGEVAAYSPAAGNHVWRGWNASSSPNVNTSQIYANGSAVFAGTVSASNISDIRFKENITDANPQLADTVALGSQLKNWDWKDDAPLNEELRAKRFLGLVAQEAEKVCPGLTYSVPRTKQGKELTPEVVVPAVYETKTVPAVLDDEGEVIEEETTEEVLVTEELVTPATYEELDDSYKAINHDILVMKLLGAVAELSAKVAALEAG